MKRNKSITETLKCSIHKAREAYYKGGKYEINMCYECFDKRRPDLFGGAGNKI
jgi:hypothetical protein